MHPLVEPHDYHDEQEVDPVHDSVRSDREVAAVFEKLVVNEKDDYAAGEIHKERPHPYREGVLGNPPVELENVLFIEVQEPFLVKEVPKGICQGEGLAEHSSNCGSSDPHPKNIDENGVQDCI